MSQRLGTALLQEKCLSLISRFSKLGFAGNEWDAPALGFDLRQRITVQGARGRNSVKNRPEREMGSAEATPRTGPGRPQPCAGRVPALREAADPTSGVC